MFAAMPNRGVRSMRKIMTDAERRLWSAPRGGRLKGYEFRRQHPAGPYILDFACLENHVAVEADGGQHADNEADLRRTAWLKARGWRVPRIWNNDILAQPQRCRRYYTSDVGSGSSGEGPSPSRP